MPTEREVIEVAKRLKKKVGNNPTEKAAMLYFVRTESSLVYPPLKKNFLSELTETLRKKLAGYKTRSLHA